MIRTIEGRLLMADFKEHGVSSQLIFPIKSDVILPVNEVGLSKV
jgi:hypothetical protein